MVCDRVAILVDGLVARQGTLSELTEQTVEYRITFSGKIEPVKEQLDKLGVLLEQNVIRIAESGKRKVNDVIDLLRGADVLIDAVEAHKFSLEDILVEVLADQTPASPDVSVANPAMRRGPGA